MFKKYVFHLSVLGVTAFLFFIQDFSHDGYSNSEIKVREISQVVREFTRVERQDADLLEAYSGESVTSESQPHFFNSKSIDEQDPDKKAEIADALFDKDVFDVIGPMVRKSSMFEYRSTWNKKEETAAFIVDSRWKQHFSAAGLTPAERQRASDLLIRLNTHNLEVSQASAQGLSDSEIGERYRLSDIERELRASLPNEKVDILFGDYVDAVADRPIGIEHARAYENRTKYPAYAAVTSDDPMELNAYLAAGANVNELREYDAAQTLLHYAISLESEELVEVIVAYNPKLDTRDSRGDTPLNLAAKQGNIEIVRLLIDAGADPASRDANGLTPAMGARLRGLRASDPAEHNQTAAYIEQSIATLKEAR